MLVTADRTFISTAVTPPASSKQDSHSQVQGPAEFEFPN